MLRLELEALAAENFDLELTGFDEEELAEALAKETPWRTVDPDAVPPLQGTPVSRTGDVWTLGKHHYVRRWNAR